MISQRTRIEQRRDPRTVGGFTLVELLIVMVIVGIVATILLGFFTSAYRKTQLRDGAVQLVTDLRQARLQAQRNSADSVVTLQSTATASPKSVYTTQWGTAAPVSRTLSTPVQVAPYTSGTVAYNQVTYTAPYSELGGSAAAIGVIWEVSSPVTSSKLYVKTVGVTGKVILSDTPN